MSEPSSESEPGFLEGLFGIKVGAWPILRPWFALRSDTRVAWTAALLGVLLFVPYLGSVGLWDPWEAHYAEVGREMLARRDFVFPFWESSWFFSKPPLTMWLSVLGMWAVGTDRSEGALALLTEWGVRLPFALSSIAALTLLALALARLVNSRVGLLAAFALATFPQFGLISRQAVTDTPFLAAITAAFACALLAQFDAQTKHRVAFWMGFYVLTGLAVLAKGLLGFLPAVVFAVFVFTCVLSWAEEMWLDHARWLVSSKFRARVRHGERSMPEVWEQLARMRFVSGFIVLLAVCAPWYVTLFLFEGTDDEGKRFWYRFLIHDHLNRLGAGVHTTTPGGSFTYFVEQAGYAVFPWVAAVPGALGVLAQTRFRERSVPEQVMAAFAIWTLGAFALVAFSATKFHHYLLPVLPGLAVGIAVFGERVWREGVGRHAGSALLGMVLLGLVTKDLLTGPTANERGALYGGFKNFTDLFVYNYDRPYPAELLTQPMRGFAGQALRVGDVFGGLLFALGAYFAVESHLGLPRRWAARGMGVAVVAMGLAVLLGGSGGRGSLAVPMAIAGGVFTAYAAWLLTRAPGEERWTLAGFLSVGVVSFVLGYAWGEPLAELLAPTANLKTVLTYTLWGGFAILGVALLWRNTRALASAWVLGTLAFSVWLGWDHWVALSHHWTQRDLFWRYFAERSVGEPVAAYLMNWRGETFYSRNTVKQIPLADASRRLQAYASGPGREWALVEHARLSALRNALTPGYQVNVVERDISNKFVLVTID
ncbi:MAG: ArnT family glycosyltransferase [Myxococcaceae bacterium]